MRHSHADRKRPTHPQKVILKFRVTKIYPFHPQCMQSWHISEVLSLSKPDFQSNLCTTEEPQTSFIYSGCRHEPSFAQCTRLYLWMKRTGNDPEMWDCSPESQLYSGLHQDKCGSRSRQLILTHYSALLRPHPSVKLWKIISLRVWWPFFNVFHLKSFLYVVALVSKQTPAFGELQLKTHSLA